MSFVTQGFTKQTETGNCQQCNGARHIEGGAICPTCMGTGTQKIPYYEAHKSGQDHAGTSYNGNYPAANAVVTKSDNNPTTGANAFHSTDSDGDGVPDEVV